MLVSHNRYSNIKHFPKRTHQQVKTSLEPPSTINFYCSRLSKLPVSLSGKETTILGQQLILIPIFEKFSFMIYSFALMKNGYP